MTLSSYKDRTNATLRQRDAQFRGGPQENRLHPQGFGGFEIRGTVIYEDALLGNALGNSQRKAIDQRVGLTHPQIAGRKKGGEVPRQIEFADAIVVELLGLVIECGQEIAMGSGQLVEKNTRFFILWSLSGLRKDEFFELLPGERPLAEKYGPVQVRFQGYLAGFKLILCPPVSVFEFDGVERKASCRLAARRLIPSIRNDHASDIPK